LLALIVVQTLEAEICRRERFLNGGWVNSIAH